MTFVDLGRQLLDGVGAEEEPVCRRGEGRLDVPLAALHRSPVEDRPDRSGEIIRALRTLVHGQGGMNAIGLRVGRPDVRRACIAPIELHVRDSALRLALARPRRKRSASLPDDDQHFVEESLPHLVDDNQVLKGLGAKRDARRSPERERRVTREHVRVRVARGERAREVEGAAVREILLHPRQVRSDPHSRDDPAGILTAGPEQRPAARHERRLPPRRIEHAAELRIGPMASGSDDDRLARPDVQRLRAVLDVAVLPEALETRARLRIESRRIAGSDTQHPSRELLFPDDLVHVTVQDEPDTFFTCAVLQAAARAQHRWCAPQGWRPWSRPPSGAAQSGSN